MYELNVADGEKVETKNLSENNGDACGCFNHDGVECFCRGPLYTGVYVCHPDLHMGKIDCMAGCDNTWTVKECADTTYCAWGYHPEPTICS